MPPCHMHNPAWIHVFLEECQPVYDSFFPQYNNVMRVVQKYVLKVLYKRGVQRCCTNVPYNCVVQTFWTIPKERQVQRDTIKPHPLRSAKQKQQKYRNEHIKEHTHTSRISYFVFRHKVQPLCCCRYIESIYIKKTIIYSKYTAIHYNIHNVIHNNIHNNLQKLYTHTY
jgi:hypothetical protein